MVTKIVLPVPRYNAVLRSNGCHFEISGATDVSGYLAFMKKWIIRGLVAGLVLLLIALLLVGLFLDGIVKKGVETVGPELTKVSIKLDGVKISMLGGSGEINGLVVGNPEGCKTPTAIKLGSASMAIRPLTILSDKFVIRSIRVISPEITIEGSPTKNNLTKIMENVQAATGGASTNQPAQGGTKPSSPPKKLQVDEFVIAGAKVHYNMPGVGEMNVSLPDITLNDLGTGPEGITAGELVGRVMSRLTGDVAKTLMDSVSKAGKDAVNNAAGDANKAVKSITDMFKKKKE
jgi:hypothetical protein